MLYGENERYCTPKTGAVFDIRKMSSKRIVLGRRIPQLFRIDPIGGSKCQIETL